MTNAKTKLVTPLHTYELRPAVIVYYPWIGCARRLVSKRILSVHDTEDLEKPEKSTPEPEWYIDTASESTLPIISSAQRVSIFANDGQDLGDDIYKRKAVPLESMRQNHALVGRFMCTAGSIRPGSEKYITAHSSANEDGCTSRLSTGLGHGLWRDYELEDALGYTPKKGESQGMNKIEWQATGEDWGNALPYNAEISWKNGRKVDGGGMVLTGPDGVIAVYKARSARWAGKPEVESDEDSGDGNGVGVLGLCDEKIGKNLLRHVLLSAVAIEEQIMWSKGFNPRLYHAGW